MSETRRSVARVRQLSLQSPTPRRWQIRRQKTSDDEKSPKIHGDPIGSGRNRANSRSGSIRPKVSLSIQSIIVLFRSVKNTKFHIFIRVNHTA